jgi:hypothetical protein
MQNENYNHNTAVSRIIKRYVSSIWNNLIRIHFLSIWSSTC